MKQPRRQALEAVAIQLVGEGRGILAADESSNTINAAGAPWQLTFSYGRAPQSAPDPHWGGEEGNAPAPQRGFAHRIRCTSQGRAGRYSPALEHELATA